MATIKEHLRYHFRRLEDKAEQKLIQLSSIFNGIAGHTLANGLDVKIRKSPTLQTMSCTIIIGSGSRHDPEGLRGTAHALEHMAFDRSETTRNARKAFERDGGYANARTNEYETVYEFKAPWRGKASADRMLCLASDIVFSNQLDIHRLELERPVLQSEMAAATDAERRDIFILLKNSAYGLTDEDDLIGGSQQSIDRISADDLMRFQARHYGAANAKLDFSGPDSYSDIARLIEGYFGRLQKGEAQKLPPPTPHKASYRNLTSDGLQQVVIGLAYPSLTPDVQKMTRNHVLGHYLSFTMMERLRGNKHRITYSATADGRQAELLMLAAHGFPKDARAVQEEMIRSLSDLACGKIDDNAFAFAMNQQQREITERRDKKLDSRTELKRPYEVQGETYGDLYDLMQITPASLSQEMAQILTAEPTMVVIGDDTSLMSYTEVKRALKINAGIAIPVSRPPAPPVG